MGLFNKKRYFTVDPENMPDKALKKAPTTDANGIPDDNWIKCKKCGTIVYKKDISEYRICPYCGTHFRMTVAERLAITADPGTFEEFDPDMEPGNPMDYPDYDAIIKKAQDKSGIKEGVVTGLCKVGGFPAVIAVMDSHFMMGSMGSVVGEKITRAFEKATAMKLPIIVFTTSGGARMQEGIISLMQMAKVSEAVARHDDAGLLYITVLTDPTTGGVTASFAMLGDIILAEPKALVGFAGQRVIEGTIHQKLPAGFQRSEFQEDHGFVDRIVEREDMKDTLTVLLNLHHVE
ncbi:MAG: acetyl-CoA carboxylase, carboxyltransferase subunit beta [Lachnospiraceae bacterium]|jgi:acetyl-CoA carboxylase carboxyl transferase subunit beta|nr:acetyl-CoA carboxylase, carboxyltransferase subunit beta [Lachnospiraceae bacterium]MEE3460969.1 acetyl-CoA carboxylase, carboxyltransferase subunit beta [Lachnospiraceae bacterium]